ncbi:peptidoglycan DD-metalloendopeptidase family protein, partial [Salmonella enterica subsp. enterica serovar Kentucky]|nr:peptidoglycan DD-metalloendopeptidase family protein [Salmonella enterica subsp. enterica serovar Kentucky]
DTMLVREQQEVKAGQKIATMGSTGTSSTRLHFEIRYKGKSVNNVTNHNHTQPKFTLQHIDADVTGVTVNVTHNGVTDIYQATQG